jgi:hypothetical protein
MVPDKVMDLMTMMSSSVEFANVFINVEVGAVQTVKFSFLYFTSSDRILI